MGRNRCVALAATGMLLSCLSGFAVGAQGARVIVIPPEQQHRFGQLLGEVKDGDATFFIERGKHSVMRRVHGNSNNEGYFLGAGWAGDAVDPKNPYATFLKNPLAVAAADDVVYVADGGNNRILKVSKVGVMMSHDVAIVAGLDLDQPSALAIAPDGDLLIADTNHHRILAVDSRGASRTLVGTGKPGSKGDKVLEKAELDSPRGLAVLADGRVVIADTGNNRLLEIVKYSERPRVRKFGLGKVGRALSELDLRAPSDLAVLSDGSLLVKDRPNRVERLFLVTVDGLLERRLSELEDWGEIAICRRDLDGLKTAAYGLKKLRPHHQTQGFITKLRIDTVMEKLTRDSDSWLNPGGRSKRDRDDEYDLEPIQLNGETGEVESPPLKRSHSKHSNVCPVL